MSGKRAFLDLLKQEGVEYLFGNPGTTELPLMDAFATENEIRYILGLQEAAVMAMADGYAQASGKLAVVNLHVAPGLGNAMGMLYDAQKAGSPILVTAGQHEQTFTATEPILWADLPTIARPLVKWSAEVTRLVDLPRLVHRAAKTALAPPTGPVFLSLPGDILRADADVDLLGPTRIAPRTRGDKAAVEAAAALLANAKRPVIMAGDAVAQSHAHAELVELAELLGAPVYTEFVPNTASFPTSHPLFRGSMIRLAPDVRKVLGAVRRAVLGRRRSVHAVAAVRRRPDAARHRAHSSRYRSVGDRQELSAQGRDPRRSERHAARSHRRRARTDERGRTRHGARPAQDRERRDCRRADRLEDEGKEPRGCHAGAAARAAPRDRRDAAEGRGGDRGGAVVGAGIRQLIRSDDPQSFFGLRGGGIGWGLPATIGVKLALPDRPVVGLIGDGSSMYTVQALWTAAHYRIGAIFVILNNTSYRILKQRLHNMRGLAEQADSYVGMELIDPKIDFVSLARSLGVSAERAKTVHEATDLLGKALKDGGPALIEVELDRAFKPM